MEKARSLGIPIVAESFVDVSIRRGSKCPYKDHLIDGGGLGENGGAIDAHAKSASSLSSTPPLLKCGLPIANVHLSERQKECVWPVSVVNSPEAMSWNPLPANHALYSCVIDVVKPYSGVGRQGVLGTTGQSLIQGLVGFEDEIHLKSKTDSRAEHHDDEKENNSGTATMTKEEV